MSSDVERQRPRQGISRVPQRWEGSRELRHRSVGASAGSSFPVSVHSAALLPCPLPSVVANLDTRKPNSKFARVFVKSVNQGVPYNFLVKPL